VGFGSSPSLFLVSAAGFARQIDEFLGDKAVAQQQVWS
jgi:hypothetical protein